MQHFLYVFCEQDRDELLRAGYRLLKQDESQNIFVFVNQEEHKFQQLQLPYLASDKLTF